MGKRRKSKEELPDLSKRNSFTKYVLDYADTLNKIAKTKSKKDLLDFVLGAKEKRYSISDAKLHQIVDKIKRLPFFSGYKLIYDMMLKGAQLGVVTEEEEKIRRIIREEIEKLLSEEKYVPSDKERAKNLRILKRNIKKPNFKGYYLVAYDFGGKFGEMIEIIPGIELPHLKKREKDLIIIDKNL